MKFYPLQTWQRKLWQYSSGWEDKDGFSAMPSDQRLTLMAVRDHSLCCGERRAFNRYGVP